MKKAYYYLAAAWAFLFVFLFTSYPTFAYETNSLIPTIEIITDGVTRSEMEVVQPGNFPFYFNQVLILAIGYSPLEISVSKTDPEGDFLVLTGVAISSAGTVPFFKLGITGATIVESLLIGNERSPVGLVWFASWVYSPTNDPAHNYNYTLSFSF